jgi:hypothetical protein
MRLTVGIIIVGLAWGVELLPEASSNSTLSSIPVGTSTHSLVTSDGRTRSFIINRASGVGVSSPSGLVFLFHGWTQVRSFATHLNLFPFPLLLRRHLLCVRLLLPQVLVLPDATLPSVRPVMECIYSTQMEGGRGATFMLTFSYLITRRIAH